MPSPCCKNGALNNCCIRYKEEKYEEKNLQRNWEKKMRIIDTK